MDWELFKTVDDRGTAEMLAELFKSNGIPTRIDYGALETGMDGVRIFVSSELAHRARWLLADQEFSDEELTYLATGKLPNENGGFRRVSHGVRVRTEVHLM